MGTHSRTGVDAPRRCKSWNWDLEFVTRTTQYGTFMTNCHAIVVELAASVKDHEESAITFATSSSRSVTNTGEIIRADDVETGPTVEEECPAQRNARESGRLGMKS